MFKKALTTLLIIICAVAAFIGVLTWQASQGEPANALETQYVTASDRFVIITGARVRIREEGPKNAQPIILIHGFTHSLETWDGWAKALTKDYRVIRYDILGHGLTGPDPHERYAPQERASFIGNVMDELGLDHAAIAGNSLGGLAAWRFASDNPTRVDALIMLSPGAYPFNGAGDEAAEIPAAMKAYLLTVPEAGVRASANLIYADDTKVTDARIKTMRDMMRREGNGPAMIKSLEEFTLPDPTDALTRITSPTLILWGEGDILIPIDHGQKMAQTISGAKLITYPGVGHATQEEAPHLTVTDAINFLSTLPKHDALASE